MLRTATAANRIKDTAGNELAAVSSQSVTEKNVSVSAISTDDYINATEDNSAVLITGLSAGLTTGTTVTITIDDSDADLTADYSFTATTNSTGAWTTASGDLTSARLLAMDEGDLTITASATGAGSATRTVVYDRTLPSATVQSVSGGYVNSVEDDGTVYVSAAVPDDTRGVAFSISDGEATPDTLAPVGKVSAVYREKLDDSTMSAITLANQDGFGWKVARDGQWLAVGARGDDTGGTGRGTVYLIKDGDNDGNFSDATGNDVVEINDNTAGITLANSDAFGSSVALSDGLLAVGAVGDDDGGSNAGTVYLIGSGGDGWGSIESTDVIEINNATAGVTLAASDAFGVSVALSDGLLAVGAIGDDTGGSNRGAVYLIDSGADGSFGTIASGDVTKLNHSSTLGITLANADSFGSSVAISDDGVLAVGAYGDDTGGAGAGAVYILNDTNNDGDYADTGENVKLSNSTAGISLVGSDALGTAVAFDGDVLAIAASNYNFKGAVWLVADGGDAWGSVVADDVIQIVGGRQDGVTVLTDDGFGSGVAFVDGELAVGVYGDDTSGSDRGSVYMFDPAFEAALATGDFEGDGTPTVGDDKLAEGTVTVSATPTDVAGNVGTAVTSSFVYDPVVPTIASASYGGTAMSLTMSEAVWGSADADDFTVINDADGTPANVVPTGITQATSVANASTAISLTVPETVWTGVVKVYYTQDVDDTSKRVKDVAGNVAVSLAEASALTAVSGASVSFTPADGGYLVSRSGNMTIGFSAVIYTDSACSVALNSSSAGGLVSLKQGGSSGTAISKSVSYNTGTRVITINPSSTLADGAVVYVGLSDGWYSSVGGVCVSGVADAAIVTVDATAPAATLASVSGGYVGSTEDDGDVQMLATVSGDTVSVAFTAAAANDGTDTVSIAGVRSALFVEEVSDAMSALSLADGGRFGSGVARDGSWLAVGAPKSASGGTQTGRGVLGGGR